jgi:hypothetical protein
MQRRRFVTAWAGFSLATLTGCPLGADLGPRSGDGAAPGQDDKGGPGSDGGGGPAPGPAPAKPIPSELVGPWRTILTYVPPMYTGIIDPGDFSGSLGVTYTFAADGQYRYELNTARAYFGGLCFGSSSWTEWGALGVAGSEISFKPSRATNVASDTCGEWVLDDNAPTQESTLVFSIEQDAAGPLLRLRFPAGDEVLLERCRDCP